MKGEERGKSGTREEDVLDFDDQFPLDDEEAWVSSDHFEKLF